MSADDFKGPWPKRQRLAFIEDRVRAEGRINRSEIVEKFGVSVPTSSIDLRDFEEQRPGFLKYDANAKCYVMAESAAA